MKSELAVLTTSSICYRHSSFTMVAVTVGRAPEFGEGQKVVKEVAGRKLLLTRHNGEVYCMDAHCYHMGYSLYEGDLEDISVHPCIICPAHRHRIDMRTGHRIETDLCGGACSSSDQKQRIYQVFSDGDKVQVYIPDAPQQEQALPSDRYNIWALQKQALNTPPRQNFGLFGAVSSSQPSTPPHLEPYAEVKLSQSPAREEEQPQQQLEQRPRGQAQMQGHIQFRSARARAAILQNYKPPPMADPPQPRGLAGVPRAAASQSGLGAQPPQTQRTLHDMWRSQQQPQQPARTVAAAGLEDMDMD